MSDPMREKYGMTAEQYCSANEAKPHDPSNPATPKSAEERHPAFLLWLRLADEVCIHRVYQGACQSCALANLREAFVLGESRGRRGWKKQRCLLRAAKHTVPITSLASCAASPP